MIPARGGLRDSCELAGGLGTSKHPHCVEKKDLWNRTVLPLDSCINRVQALARISVQVLEGFKLFLCKELNGRYGKEGDLNEFRVTLSVYT